MHHNFFLNETLFVKLDIKYEIIFFLSFKLKETAALQETT